ncbi:MAG: GNAT family N-acetyltransferase, partial [Spirochaetia bacterium]
MTEQVTTTHLVMNSPATLRPRVPTDQDVEVVLVSPPNPQLNHSLFMEIGTPFRWHSRLSWEYIDWDRYVNDPSVETWIGLKSGGLFGYFELQHRVGPTGIVVTEIMFFGVYASRSGRGFGAHLLTHAVRNAWKIPGTERVYVHTCTSDHPAALANYTARGFSVERTETETEKIPDADDPIWSSPR